MHTVERLEQVLAVAQQLGYQVRQEWLGGSGGGSCEIKGRKVLFVDLALSALEQLDQAADALQRDARLTTLKMPVEVRQLLTPRRAA